MKRHLFLFVFSLVLLLSAGCNRMDSFDPDYPIVDWYPVNLIVTVQDSQGNDLLDPEHANNYFEGASLVFRGKQYDVQGIEDDPYAAVSTKYYMPHMRGLRLAHDTLYFSKDQKELCHFLVFGELDGAEDMDEDIELQWRDGTREIIHYHCSDHKIEKKSGGEWDITCKREWMLNGEVASNPFRLVK